MNKNLSLNHALRNCPIFQVRKDCGKEVKVFGEHGSGGRNEREHCIELNSAQSPA